MYLRNRPYVQFIMRGTGETVYYDTNEEALAVYNEFKSKQKLTEIISD